MARTATQHATFSKGVLDPDLSERQDLKHYYDSLADGENLEIKPQGGVARRAGTRTNWDADLPGITARTRNRLRPILLSQSMVTLHNGGDAAALVSQEFTTPFTTTDVTGSLFIVVEIDRGSAADVCFVDLLGFWCQTGGRDQCVGVQYYTGSSWEYMPGPSGTIRRYNVRASSANSRTRRFGGRPGVTVNARYFRVVVTGGTGIGTFSLLGMRFMDELDKISPARAFAVDRAADAIYDLILTDLNVDVFRRMPDGGRRYTASVPVNIGKPFLDDVAVYSSADTMLLFHEDIRTGRITRQGSHFEWNSGTLPASNVPAMRPGVSFAGDQDEIQEISFPDLEIGDRFSLVMGAQHTHIIELAEPMSSVAAEIADKLGDLSQLSGDPVVTALSSNPPTFQIAFTGANGARAHAPVQAIVLDPSDSEPVHTLVQPGLDASGPYFGFRTGWPRCGTYSQGRLLLAGFRAAPNAWGVSAIDTFDFDDTPAGTNPLTADMAFFRALETDQLETIQQVFVGRNLQFFTDSSEWYVETRTLDATQPANAVRATGVGIKPSVRVALAEGATVIVQSGGRTVRDFLYSDVEQSYKAEPLSLLAPHLFEEIVDVGYRKALSTDEANLIYFLNAGGSLVALSLLRAQEVVGCVRHTTPGGKFRSVATHQNGDVLFIVERTVNSRTSNFIELRDPSTPLDASGRFSYTAPRFLVEDLGNLNGLSGVWVYSDGQLCGPFTVGGAQVTIDTADAGQDVVAGLAPAVHGALQKYRPKAGEMPPFRLPARIYEAGLALKNTGALQIRSNGGPWRDVLLTWHNGTGSDSGQMDGKDYGPDVPLLDRLFTGEAVEQNLRGWSKHPRLEFRQEIPAPLHIKAIRYEIAGKS